MFLHGYLHGYEEGFHLADIDLQLSRMPRDAGELKKAGHVMGYVAEFGSKHFFEAGYHQGFRVGYADGVAGRRFRAVSQLDKLTLQRDSANRPSVPFDEGFSTGYSSGKQQGVADARRDAPFAPPNAACPSTSVKTENQQEFCAAYASGYRVGYSDGFINVARQPTTEAVVDSK